MTAIVDDRDTRERELSAPPDTRHAHRMTLRTRLLLAPLTALLAYLGMSAPAVQPNAQAVTGTSVSATSDSSQKFTLVLLEHRRTAFARRGGAPVPDAIGFYIPRGAACGRYKIGETWIRFPTGLGGTYIVLPDGIGEVEVQFWEC